MSEYLQKINYLSQAQYDAAKLADELNESDIYLTPFTIAASDISTSDDSDVQTKLNALAATNGDISSALAAILGV